MMVGDQERRAVAKRLRGIAGRRCYGLLNDIDFLEDAIGCSIGQDWQDQDWWHRLADLIDRPTCENIGGEEGTNGEYYDFFCSACGFAANVTDPKYCPNCGAEVVE